MLSKEKSFRPSSYDGSWYTGYNGNIGALVELLQVQMAYAITECEWTGSTGMSVKAQCPARAPARSHTYGEHHGICHIHDPNPHVLAKSAGVSHSLLTGKRLSQECKSVYVQHCYYTSFHCILGSIVESVWNDHP